MTQKIFAVILCIALALSLGTAELNASAAEGCTITVDTVSANPGDTVTINIVISNNPGIMAMTFTVAYDTNVLTYEKYNEGILTDYTVGSHVEKKHNKSCELREIQQI